MPIEEHASQDDRVHFLGPLFPLRCAPDFYHDMNERCSRSRSNDPPIVSVVTVVEDFATGRDDVVFELTFLE